ncbi:MAG: radical SAM protein, partial [Candidatus Thermoplasmatota archaeon]
LSEYVMPGLGGRGWSREHAVETARVLNEIGPDFIRLRSLMVRENMPLHARVQSGEFELLSDDEMVQEIGWFIEGLECRSEVKSDHILNLLPEIDGKLPDDKERLLGVVRKYLSLPDAERLHFRLGRRAGYYERLADMDDPVRRGEVERVQRRLEARGPEKVEEAMARLRAQYM